MTRGGDHRVTILRRGRSHTARCSCGWNSHAWNELRPAEADAWHHIYGDSVIVDVAAIPDERGPDGPVGHEVEAPVVPVAGDPRSGAVERLVQKARTLADRPSPYAREAVAELWRVAAQDRLLVQAAISEIGELLSVHSRRSAGAADSEWLQLITAKRLLGEALAHEEQVLH